jgi:5'-nucleotidase
MAISHYRKRDLSFDWDWAARQTAALIEQFLSASRAPQEYWNVNLPHFHPDEAPTAAEIRFCPPCIRPLPVNFRQEKNGHYAYCGVYSERDRIPGSDVDHCFSGRISVSKLRIY